MKPQVIDLIQPGASPYTLNRLLGQIQQARSHQTTAADDTGGHLWVATFDGYIGDLYLQLSAAAAANETMSIDVKKNGSSIFTAPKVTASGGTAAKTQVDLVASIDAAKRDFVTGDVFTVDRDYTAGGGATPLANNDVVLEPCLGQMTQV